MLTVSFREWCCGCIGILLETQECRQAWCIHPCDKDEHAPVISCYQRNTLLEKPSVELDIRAATEVLIELRRACIRADHYDDLQRVLRIATQEDDT